MVRFLTIAVLLVFFGCSSREQLQSDIVIINTDPSRGDDAALSSIFTDLEYTALDSSISVSPIFESWFHTTIHKDLVVLFEDGSVYENIYCYALNGELITNISLAGSGIGKVTNGSGYFIDSDSNINVVDNFREKLVKYNLYTGEFIEEYDIFDDYGSITKSDNHYLFHMLNQVYDIDTISYNLILTDKKFNVINRYWPIPKYLSNFRMKDYTFSNPVDGNVLVKNFLSKDIYIFAGGDLRKAFLVDFKGKWVSPDVLAKLSIDNSRDIRREILYNNFDHVYNIVNLLQFDNKIMFTYYYQQKLYWCIYDKATKKAVTIESRKNDLDYGPLGENRYWPRSVVGDRVVFVLQVEDMIFAYKNTLKNKTEEEIKILRQNLSFLKYEEFVNDLSPLHTAVIVKAKINNDLFVN